MPEPPLGKCKEVPDTMQSLGLARPLEEAPTLGQRLWNSAVWILTESDTELSETGCAAASAYYALTATLHPDLLNQLIGLATLNRLITPGQLAIAASIGPVLAIIGAVRNSTDWRRAATLAHVAFFAGVGGCILHAAPTAYGMGLYLWAALVSAIAYIRLRSHRRP